MPSLTLSFLGPLTLLTLSIPLFFLASITATLAFSALLLRVLVVYIELGLALLSTFFGSSSKLTSNLEEIYRAQQAETTERLKRQRSGARRRGVTGNSNSIYSSAKSLAPPTNPAPRNPTKSTSITNLPSYAPPPALENRDYEGVGGWRLPPLSTSTADAARDDAIWMSLNSRLQLPTPGAGVLPASVGVGHVSGDTTPRPRRHKRSLTSGSQRFARSNEPSRSPEQFRMSPMQSRRGSPPRIGRSRAATSPEAAMKRDVAVGSVEGERGRTPGEERQGEGGYFTMASPQHLQMQIMSPEEVATERRMERRRQSVGASSSGSNGSGISTGSGLTMEGLSTTIS